MKDKFRQIVEDSVYSVAIMGDVSTGSFELIDMQPLGKEAPMMRNMTFLGVIGIAEGWCRVALTGPLEQKMSSKISQAFLGCVEAAACSLESEWTRSVN